MAIGLTHSSFPQGIHPLSRGMESIRNQGIQQSCVVHAFATFLEGGLRDKYEGIRIKWKMLVNALERRKLEKGVFDGIFATEITNLILIVEDENGRILTVRMKRPLTEDEPCVRHSGDDIYVRFCSFGRVCAYMETTGFPCLLTMMQQDYVTKQYVKHDVCAVRCLESLQEREEPLGDKLLGANSFAAQATVLVNESIYRGHCEIDPVIIRVQNSDGTDLAIPLIRDEYKARMEKWGERAIYYPAKIEEELYDRLASPEKTLEIMRVKELEEVLKQADKMNVSSSLELLDAITSFGFHLKELEKELKGFREQLAMPTIQEKYIQEKYQEQYTEAMEKWGQLENKYNPKIRLPERSAREMLTERNLEARVKAVEEDLRRVQQAQKLLSQELHETSVESSNLQKKQGNELKRISDEVLRRLEVLRKNLPVHRSNEYCEFEILLDSRMISSFQNPASPLPQNPPSPLPQNPASPLSVSKPSTFPVSDRQLAIRNIERMEASTEATFVSVFAKSLEKKYGILIDEMRLVNELKQLALEAGEFHEPSIEELCSDEIQVVDLSNEKLLTVQMNCLQIGDPSGNRCLKNSDLARLEALERLDAYVKTTGLFSLVMVMSRDPEKAVDFQHSVCATSRLDSLGEKIVLIAHKRWADLSTMAMADVMTITDINYCGHIEMDSEVIRVQNIRDLKDLDEPVIEEEYAERMKEWEKRLESKPYKAQIKKLTRKLPASSVSRLGGRVTKAEEGVKQLDAPSFSASFSEKQSLAITTFCNEQVKLWAEVQRIWTDVDRINEQMNSIDWNYMRQFPPLGN